MGDTTTPEKLDLSVSLPKDTPDVTQKLDALRTSIEKDLGSGTKVRQVAVYCQTNGIDCEAWNDKGSPTAPQLKEITGAFSGVAVIRDKLIPLLTDADPTQRNWARKTLAKITELIKTQQAELKDFKKESTDLKQDVCGKYLEGVGERARETFKNHPWASIIASGVALYTTYLLYNHDTHSKWFKPIVQGGVLLGVANFFSRIVSTDNKSIVERVQKWVQGTPNLGAKVSAFVDQFKGIDTEILQTSLKMGSIRFDYFLDAYKSARNGKMDMAALKRRAVGLRIPDDVFNESNGEGLYKLMEQLCEKKGKGDKKAGLRKLEKDYGSEGEYQIFNFTQVAFVEGFDPSGVVVTDEVAGARAKAQKESGKSTVAAAAAGAAGAAGAAESEKSVPKNSQEEELYEISGFEGVGLELHPAGWTAVVCGYSLPYARTVESDGSVHYKITDSSIMVAGGEPIYFDFEVGSGADLEKSKTVLADMNTYLRLKTAYLLRIDGLPINPDALRYEQGVWMASYPGVLDYSLGGVTNPSLKLEIKPTSTNALTISCNGHETSGKEFIQNIQNETLATVLSSVPKTSHADGTDSTNLLFGLSVKIISVDPIGTTPRGIKGTAEGAPFECHYDLSKKEYIFTQIPLNATVIDKKAESVESLTEFNALFDRLQAAGGKLSPWLRGASDIFMSWTWADAEWPDSTNDQWHAFVSFKRGEILDLYRTELQKVDPSAPDSVAKMKLAYDATIGDFLKDFQNLPSELDAAQAVNDEAEAKKLVEKFRTFGYSSSYNTVRDVFVQKAEKMNFPGFAEKSNAAHQRCFFFLQQQYTRLTAPLIRQEFEPARGNPYYDYDAYVQREIMAILGRAEKNPTQVDGFLSRTWETFVKDGASWNELQAAKPEFDRILTFDRWQSAEHRSPDLEAMAQAARPELKGHEKDWVMEPVPGNAWQFKMTWYPGKSYSFDATLEINPVTHMLEYTNLPLDEQWVNNYVEAIGGSPEFNQYFEALNNQFAGAVIAAGGVLPDVTKVWNNIDEGAWKSLVKFKREQILGDYRRNLLAIASDPSMNPQQKAQAFDRLHLELSDRYLRDTYQLNQRLNVRIKKMQQDSDKEITADEFTRIYIGLERMNYNNTYFFLMRDARSYYERFNYSGWPNDSEGVNAVLALVHEKTAFMNEPNHTTITPEEKAYFHAVQDEVDNIVRQAHANKNGTGSWLRAAIGPEELPTHLNIPDFKTWYNANPNAGKPSVNPATGPVGPNNPKSNPEYQRLQGELQSRRNTLYNNVVYKDYAKGIVADAYDADVVKDQKDGMDYQDDQTTLRILANLTEETTVLVEYENYLKQKAKEAGKGFLDKIWDWI